MAHTAKHKKEQKDKKASAKEQFNKFLEEKGKKPEPQSLSDKESGKRKPGEKPKRKPGAMKGKRPEKNEGFDVTKEKNNPGRKGEFKKDSKKKDAPAKYDKVVLGGNKGDKSKTKPGKKDYDGAGKHHAPGKDGYMDGFTYSKPAKKLGFIQKFGGGRISPGKMGDEVAAKMMHGDAAAKYY